MLGEGVAYASSLAECLEGAECCFIATEWEEFKRLTPSKIRLLMKEAVVVDCKRMFEPSRFEAKGVRYVRVGTPASQSR